MIRTLALLVRRPDLTRAAFREHYEEIHAPLAQPLLEGLGFYVRNHVRRSLDAEEPAFDVLSEFGYASAAALEATAARMAAADGDAIRADELRFMDKPRNVYFEVRRLGALGEEPPVPDVELGPVPAAGVKIALLTRCGDAALEECRDAHRRAFAPLALGAAGWEHWSTHAVGDVTPPVDAVTFACFEADRFDELRVRAFQPDRFDCQRLIVTECRSDCASGAAL